MNQLHFISTSTFYRDVLEYIYILSKEQITDFFYVEEEKYKSYRYNEKQSKGKVLIPGEIDIDVPYKGDIVKFSQQFQNFQIIIKTVTVVKNIKTSGFLCFSRSPSNINLEKYFEMSSLHGKSRFRSSFWGES